MSTQTISHPTTVQPITDSDLRAQLREFAATHGHRPSANPACPQDEIDLAELVQRRADRGDQFGLMLWAIFDSLPRSEPGRASSTPRDAAERMKSAGHRPGNGADYWQLHRAQARQAAGKPLRAESIYLLEVAAQLPTRKEQVFKQRLAEFTAFIDEHGRRPKSTPGPEQRLFTWGKRVLQAGGAEEKAIRRALKRAGVK